MKYIPQQRIFSQSMYFLDNVARFVDDHGYIISRDNYVQPGEAKNTEFKFINHRALK